MGHTLNSKTPWDDVIQPLHLRIRAQTEFRLCGLEFDLSHSLCDLVQCIVLLFALSISENEENISITS